MALSSFRCQGSRLPSLEVGRVFIATLFARDHEMEVMKNRRGLRRCCTPLFHMAWELGVVKNRARAAREKQEAPGRDPDPDPEVGRFLGYRSDTYLSYHIADVHHSVFDSNQ
jgi:hypothetical protein